MTHVLPPQLQFPAQLVLDFGAPLPYLEVCNAYTKEKFSLYTHTTERFFETIALKAPTLPTARLEGRLYYITDEDEIIKLDNIRGNGVSCDRKTLPILVPYQNQNGDLVEIKAHVYIGRREFWEQRINYGMQCRRAGEKIVRGGSYDLVDRVPDYNKLLHNRMSFIAPDPVPYPVRDLSPAMVRYVAKKNDKEALRIQVRSVMRKIKDFMRE